MANSVTGVASTTGISSINFAAPAGYDTDAQTYFTATGITDTAIKGYINTLVLAAKANGWWTPNDAIYPFAGGTAATHAVNLKQPGTFNLTFVNASWIHSATGANPTVGNGSYATTGYTPSVNGSLNSASMGFYSRTSASQVGVEMGATDGTNRQQLYIRYTDNLSYGIISNNTYVSPSNTDASGFSLVSRTTSTLITLYRNGSSVGTNTTVTGARVSREIYVSANNASGARAEDSYRELSFVTIGLGINSTIAASMYTDIQAYQTSMARQV